MMNETEHLLTILAEECAEVALEVAKALRFGLDDGRPGQTFTNAERITHELDDLAAVAEMLRLRGAIPMPDDLRQWQKGQKVAHFMVYARERGTLEPAAEPQEGE